MIRSLLTQHMRRRIVSTYIVLSNLPVDDLLSALRYIPTTPAAFAFGSLYLVTFGVFVILSFQRYGRYMLVLMLSTQIYAVGLFLRLCKCTH